MSLVIRLQAIDIQLLILVLHKKHVVFVFDGLNSLLLKYTTFVDSLEFGSLSTVFPLSIHCLLAREIFIRQLKLALRLA